MLRCSAYHKIQNRFLCHHCNVIFCLSHFSNTEKRISFKIVLSYRKLPRKKLICCCRSVIQNWQNIRLIKILTFRLINENIFANEPQLEAVSVRGKVGIRSLISFPYVFTILLYFIDACTGRRRKNDFHHNFLPELNRYRYPYWFLLSEKRAFFYNKYCAIIER